MHYTIHYTNECNSTNVTIKEIVSTNHDEITILRCGFQTAGKGQRGNFWESEREKNLTFSLSFFPHNLKGNEQFLISQAVSLGVKNVFDQYAEGFCIKWPNDIYWNDKKIGGILIENVLTGDKVSQSVIGIGLNINQDTFKSNAPNPISLKQITKTEYDLTALFELFIEEIVKNLDSLLNEKKRIILTADYKTALFRKDGFYRFSDGEITFFARIKDVLNNGLLVLETEKGEIREFAFKEISYLL